MADTSYTIKESNVLPFTEEKQSACLCYLIQDPKFVMRAMTKIKPEWFSSPFNAQLYNILLKFIQIHGNPPISWEELRHSAIFVKENTATIAKLDAAYNLCKINAMKHSFNVLAKELDSWLKSRVLFQSLQENTHLYNLERYNETAIGLSKAVKEFQSIKFYGDDVARFDTFMDDFKQAMAEREGALSTGLPLLDQKIDPSCVNGALLKGDTTILLAPTNAGKTTAMITMAVHNIKNGKDVLFISHEGRESDLKEKFWSAITRKTKPDMLKAIQNEDPQVSKVIQKMTLAYNLYVSRHLTYMAMNKPGLTVEEVAAIIEEKQDEKKRDNNGKGYDLLVCDYPAKLSMAEFQGKSADYRIVQEKIYNYFVQLALDHNMHALLAIQTNREGSKINKGHKGSDKRLLSMEDVAEAWGPMTIATTVISLNRSPEDEIKQRLTYYICKSRSSEKGYAVVAKTHYDMSLSHLPDEPAVCYKGTTPQSHKVTDEIFEQYKNQYLPPDLLGKD